MSRDTYNRALLRAELRRDEDERFRVYRCTAGKLSIGVGRNLDDKGITAAETAKLGITVASCIRNGITRSQSAALLEDDIDETEADLDGALPWWRTLTSVRQRVLLNMCFNMGLTKLLKFRAMLAAAHAGLFVKAAAEMVDSAWHDQVGARAVRLERMMTTGSAA